MLDISKIEAGKMDLYIETFSVAKVTRDVAAIILPLTQNNGNQLVTQVAEDVGTMHADLTKFRQSLFNLLSNAGKFTHEGIIRLAISSARRPAMANGCCSASPTPESV